MLVDFSVNIPSLHLSVLTISFIAGWRAYTASLIPRYKLQFSKITQAYVVKPIKEIQPKPYRVDLLDTLISLKLAVVDPIFLPSMSDIPANIAPVEKTEKEDVIRCKRSRFPKWMEYLFTNFILTDLRIYLN